MKCVLALVALLAVLPYSLGAGAGRAFPVASENYAIEEFQRINRGIEWDPTNFLVDLSGNWANCQRVGSSGEERVDTATPEGESIVAVVDFTAGDATDVNAANGYIRDVIGGWIRRGIYDDKIRRADRFGCSIRPGCNGYAVIGCLFSPAGYGGFEEIDNPEGEQNALAFTPQQYELAAQITHHQWDQSHFLENLSGFETECSMVDAMEFDFAHAVEVAGKRGMRITGLFGSSPNVIGTQPAMEEILWGFKEIPNAAQVGCSVIPDCRGGRGDISDEMYVVISCLYEEY